MKFVLAWTSALILGCSGGGGDGDTSAGPPPPGGNRNPTVNLNIDRTAFNYGQTATLTATPTDPDGDQVTLAWSAGRGAVQSSGPTATTATYTAPNSWGADSVAVTVSDGRGGTGRATAGTYVRNPSPPNIALGATGSTNCGHGTPIPDGLILTITPAENVLVTNISMQPRGCTGSTCRSIINHNPPLALSAGVAFTWSAGGCQSPQCCQNFGCGSCGFWTITVSGLRPAPDGGAFVYHCNSWSGPGTCN